jgi:hypothetical protein
MAYITPTDIKYYRVNANNTTIAQSPLGDSGAPSEEIAAPLQSNGTFSSIASLAITGDGTNFLNFEEGQYLYYIDSNGNYQLVGQIATIPTNISLTITATAVNEPETGDKLAAAYALITNNESIYVRIPTVSAGTNTLEMPNFGLNGWRLGNGNPNESVAILQQISAAGTPLVELEPNRTIPFTFVTMNVFTPSGQVNGITTYFASSGQFPNFIWIKVTPSIGASTTLASQTLYRFNINESQPSISPVVGLNCPQTVLTTAGYSFTGGGSGFAGGTNQGGN